MLLVLSHCLLRVCTTGGIAHTLNLIYERSLYRAAAKRAGWLAMSPSAVDGLDDAQGLITKLDGEDVSTDLATGRGAGLSAG